MSNLYPEDFGAIGDCDPCNPTGNKGTDDSAALKACFAATKPGDVVVLERFYRAQTRTLASIKRGVSVEGRGWATGIFHDNALSSEDALFRVECGAYDVAFRNLYLAGRQHDPNLDGNSGRKIMIVSPDANTLGREAQPHDVLIQGCKFSDGWEAVWAGQYPSTTFGAFGPYNITVRDCVIYDHEHGINLQGTRGHVVIDGVSIEMQTQMQRGIFLTGTQGGVNISNVTTRGVPTSAIRIYATDAGGKQLSGVNLCNVHIYGPGNPGTLYLQTTGAANDPLMSDVYFQNVQVHDKILTQVQAQVDGQIVRVGGDIHTNGDIRVFNTSVDL